MLKEGQPILAWIFGIYLVLAGGYSLFEIVFQPAPTRTVAVFPLALILQSLTLLAGVTLLARHRASIYLLALIAIWITVATARSMYLSPPIESVAYIIIYVTISLLACYLMFGYSIYLDRKGYFKR